MNQFSGISISNGIGIGSATIILTQEKKLVDSSKISEAEFDAGWELLLYYSSKLDKEN